MSMDRIIKEMSRIKCVEVSVAYLMYYPGIQVVGLRKAAQDSVEITAIIVSGNTAGFYVGG
jgi:hypothetical protein